MGLEGIEPPLSGLEPEGLPLTYSPFNQLRNFS